MPFINIESDICFGLFWELLELITDRIDTKDQLILAPTIFDPLWLPQKKFYLLTTLHFSQVRKKFYSTLLMGYLKKKYTLFT